MRLSVHGQHNDHLYSTHNSLSLPKEGESMYVIVFLAFDQG